MPRRESRESRKSRKRSSKSKRTSRRTSKRTSKRRSRISLSGGGEGSADYVHKLSSTSVVNGKVEVHEEYIIKGDKGLLIKHYHKDDKSKVKLVMKEKDDGSFSVRQSTDGKMDEKDMSRDEVLKMLAKEKHLKFALDYLKKK